MVPIKGDITQPHLGISPTDRATLEQNVSVVFHAAATIKFDEELRLSVAMNVQGTLRLVELCNNMKKLVVSVTDKLF